MSLPEIKHNDMYQLLREEKVQEFNARRAGGETCDLTHCDFRGLDLRGLNAHGIDFTGSYFRQADLRGINFSESRMQECSLNGAKISGVYFPQELSPAEIEMSLNHGTRMRYSS
ncbi:MAG: pentapeptide repeat-containing protein [Gammaproteobacteria bacterium]|nr:pentapeptide repeat-containing protein [Gammaproteobacteria bacterium]MDH5799941.1 pentapeptide repeat-containing protein [Gammaproteobacteria bacterium]